MVTRTLSENRDTSTVSRGIQCGRGRSRRGENLPSSERGLADWLKSQPLSDHGCPDPYAVIGAVGSMGSFQVTG